MRTETANFLFLVGFLKNIILGIVFVPPDIGQKYAAAVTTLDLSHNELTAVGGEVLQQFKNLKTLGKIISFYSRPWPVFAFLVILPPIHLLTIPETYTFIMIYLSEKSLTIRSYPFPPSVGWKFARVPSGMAKANHSYKPLYKFK